jgi:hypothetical protein
MKNSAFLLFVFTINLIFACAMTSAKISYACAASSS